MSEVSTDDVRRALGPLDQRSLAEIVALAPTLQDLSDAAGCLKGGAEEAAPSSAVACAIVDIIARLAADWREDDR